MGKINKNKYNLFNKTNGVERRNEATDIIMSYGNILPQPITYRDIDKALKDYVINNLTIDVDDSKLLVEYFTQQRFSEFTKTWEHVDKNGVIHPNFVIITRENNPKKGSSHGELYNIPGDRFYNIGFSEKIENGNKILISYKIKQPYAVDFIYEIKFIANKTDYLNEFNNNFLDNFKSLQSYVNVKGHYMSMVIEDISDESEYDLTERKVFIQTYSIKLRGYIINKKDIKIEENIYRLNMGVGELNKNKTVTYDKDIIFDFPKNIFTCEMKMKDYYLTTNIILENISSYNLYINNKLIEENSFELNKFDKINIRIDKNDINKISKITFLKS